mmetsp:Transcript_32089/g.75025  ORF Transcript_32089/g.75025 Transcript_32089/m.75025 type:complete len:245 (-) Transcript_32089:97-831(-)
MATPIVDSHARYGEPAGVATGRSDAGVGAGSGHPPSGAPTDHHNLEEACRFCFDVLMSHFRRTACPKPGFPNGEYPLFVTWQKFDQQGGSSLRGCIGNLTPIDIHDGVKKYASVSAFNDKRFSPVAEREVGVLECSVTLLFNFQEASHYLDWQVGVHGIIIEFELDRQSLSATYLPSVCSEQGWSQDECIKSLVRKAGYNGAVSQNLLKSIRLTRYEGRKATVPFDKYAVVRKRMGLWPGQWGP